VAEADAVRTTPRPPPLSILGRATTAADGYPLSLAGAIAAAALAPAYVVRWHIGLYPTTALEAAILATLAAFLYESVRLGRWPVLRSAVSIAAVVLLLAGAISVLDAPARIAALGIYRAYFIEPILMAVVLVTVVRTRRQAYYVLLGLLAGATVLALANSTVVIRAMLDHTFRPQPPPVAIYLVSNAIALFLLPVAAVTAAIAIHHRKDRFRFVFALFAAVIAVSVVLSFSRGGWAALVVVAAALALSTRLRWPLLAVVAATALAVSRVPLIAEHLAPMFQLGPSQTFDSRVPLWKASLKMLEANPLLGAGLSGFQQRTKVYDGSLNVTYPHNLFLNFWSETGLLGLAAFLAIFVAAAAVSWLGWRSGSVEWRPLHLGVLLALAAIFVHGMVDVPYFKNDLSLEFWLLVGLPLAGRRAAQARPG